MQNAQPVMRQYQEHIQDLKPDGWHRKEVAGDHGLHVVVKKGWPGLRGRLLAALRVLAHAGFADVDASLSNWP
jgi:hypothetical protein